MEDSELFELFQKLKSLGVRDDGFVLKGEKTKAITLRLPERLIKAITALAKQNRNSREAYIRLLIAKHLAEYM